jgi:L-seryl-tRNA(Ser) seleniumtransferase
MSLEHIPSVNEVVERVTTVAAVPRPLVVDATRAVIDQYRQSLLADDATAVSAETLATRVAERLVRDLRPPLAPVINATGIIIHTGLGRAPLARTAVDAMAAVAGGYAPVELDMETGRRGHRADVVRDLLCRLTGAESATVVNNNAAALLLVLSTLASNRSVIVSRGELIEIGGSFRLPDIITAGGALLREVGTTNRTRLGDYERAVDESTAAVLKVHPSNYRIQGFRQEVAIDQLVGLGSRHQVVVIHDIGSGALGPLDHLGLGSSEPAAITSVKAGADLVLFSGDKLLGGPQAGIIVGRRVLIETIQEQPMMRALRVDKITLAALGATLQLHLDKGRAVEHLPVFAMAAVPVDELRRRGARVVEQLASLGTLQATVEDSEAYLGGGSLPTEALPSCAVVLRSSRIGENELLDRLRRGQVVGRACSSAVYLDLRTVQPDQDKRLVAAIRSTVE